MELSSDLNHWSLLKKIGFRFIFIFFLLFIVMSNNGAYPFWYLIFSFPTKLLYTVIPWIGKHILHLPYDITVFANGSGDTTYDYVIVFTAAAIAILGTLIWSGLDRKRINYQTLYYWLTVAIRFYVGFMLINYGLIKIIKLQFPSPGFSRLIQSYGDSSPMGLAWTFLGFSDGYNLFMGIAEVAAILLLFRRTMTVGAIITLMTASNVMAVNYFYDVPVKIASTALVVMTLFLLLNDAKRLFTFFFTGEAISLPVIKPQQINKKWLKITKLTFKVLIIGYTVILGLLNTLNFKKSYGSQAPKPKLYGLYNIDSYIHNKSTVPPLTTDSTRWKELIVEWEGYAQVNYMTNKTTYFSIKTDTALHKIDFTNTADTTVKYSFTYERPNADKLNLKGMIKKDSVSIFMTRKNLDDYLLMNRGFHWISEYPFNR